MSSKQPHDQFEQYFTEKLWEMIPPFYREQDASTETPGTLRALVEVLAEQAAVLRRSHDRLWDDQYIETCDDWAVVYLAKLVGTRLVSALNTRGRRIDVAKTLYYRRRKGTLRVLEELLHDIAGWEGKVVESFRQLARSRHNLDGKLQTAQWSQTPRGGTADLRHTLAAELTDGPFDEFMHTIDIRQYRGKQGRYGISKLACHIYRLSAQKVTQATPRNFNPGTDTHFTFDPSGREIPLFMPRQRPEQWEQWRTAQLWELPGPMPCRILGHTVYRFTAENVQAISQTLPLSPEAKAGLQSLIGVTFRHESRMHQILGQVHSELETVSAMAEILQQTLIPSCGKFALWNEAVGLRDAFSSEQDTLHITSGALNPWMTGASWPAELTKHAVIDPVRGRFQLFGITPADNMTVIYHYGLAGDVGAGTYSRLHVEATTPDDTRQGGDTALAAALAPQGTIQIEDSLTYTGVANQALLQDLTLQAANQERPYLRLGSDWFLQADPNQEATLTIDGLWIGSDNTYSLRLQENYQQVTLRHCTLDPGGQDAEGQTIYPVPLVIEGAIAELVIEKSIIASIQIQGQGRVDSLQIYDSILDTTSSSNVAISTQHGTVKMQRTTVFGQIEAYQIEASEVIVTGTVDVANTQQGCFRYSAAPTGSRLPRPYRRVLLDDDEHIFTSRLFGQPGYAQLSQTAPLDLYRGAANGGSIGVFANTISPIKQDSITQKLEEYMPFGLIPMLIEEN